MPQLLWQTAASDKIRGYRQIPEAELAGRLWENTPGDLRWDLDWTIIRELEEEAPVAEEQGAEATWTSTQPPGRRRGRGRWRPQTNWRPSWGAGGSSSSSSTRWWNAPPETWGWDAAEGRWGQEQTWREGRRGSACTRARADA